MKEDFTPLSHIQLQAGTGYVRPPELPKHVHLDSPALDVITDFTYVRPQTVGAQVTIDDALEHMRASGVRLLLVTDDVEHIIGLISAYDIQGERPVRLVQESRVPRSTITVAQIMTPLDEIQVLSMISVRNAQVRHIVHTLQELEQGHLLVCETDEEVDTGTELVEDQPPLAAAPWQTGHASPRRPTEQRVRGLFSAAQIGRQLGVDVSEVMPAAHSLAEISLESYELK